MRYGEGPSPAGLLRVFFAGVVLPIAALLLQSVLWLWIQPYVWFLAYPAVFCSSWLAGGVAGLLATLVATAGVYWFYIPPVGALVKGTSGAYLSTLVFVGLGVMFTAFNGRLRRALGETAEALEKLSTTNEQLRASEEKASLLYQETLAVDALKTAFFANVSHEFRTPITLILGIVEREKALSSGRPEEQRNLGLIERNARLLERHVDDLLDVAKIDAGRLDVRYARIDVGELVRMCASLFSLVAEEKYMTFEVDSPALTAAVDPDKLQRIVVNLLSNAFKFTPPGGTIRVTVGQVDGEVRIVVADNGPGVPESMREAVFERFQQADMGFARGHGGTGLGLAIVVEFVRAMQGKVGLKVGGESGAQFTVRLPLEAPQGVSVEEKSVAVEARLALQVGAELGKSLEIESLPRPSRGRARLLVVEDNPDMRAFLVEALQEDYDVETAENGRAGLASAIEHLPDLIITDLMMPEMSGEEMLNALRADPRFEAVPVIALTASGDSALRRRVLEKAQDCLPKPFTVSDLRVRVRRLLEERDRSLQRTAAAMRAHRDLFDHMLNGYAHCRLSRDGGRVVDFVYVDVNDTFQTLTGLANVVGKRATELVPGIAEAQPNVLEIYGRVVDSGTPEQFEVWLEGLHRWFLVSAYRVGDDEFVAVFDNVTDRRRADEMRLRRRKVEALGTLAAGVAHDFNNILHAINGNAQLALQDLEPGGPTWHSVNEIAKAGSRGVDLVRRLARMGSVRRAELKLLDLRSVVDDVVGLVRSSLPPDIRLEWSCTDSAPIISGDFSELHEMLLNLVHNAVHAMEGRRGTIGVTVDRAVLPTSLVERPDDAVAPQVRLQVSDQGCGLDEETKQRMFDPFFTTRAVGKGTGLGLSLVLEITRRHGGWVHVDSEQRVGTTFSLFYPWVEGVPEGDVTARPALLAAPVSTSSILYVDDEESLLFLARRSLSRLGFRVTAFADPLLAREAFTQSPAAFDVVVTDLKMPQCSGFELARDVLAVRPDVPVFVMSGFVRVEDEVEAKAIGIRRVLVKPSTMDELAVAVEGVLKATTAAE